MTPRYKTCQICGIQFTGHFNAKFCGKKCQKQFKRGYEKAYRQAHKEPEEAETYEPFPAHLDRQYFGSWLSGFADGEATFVLRDVVDAKRKKRLCYAFFRIVLRDDDAEVLRWIRSFWQCGTISYQTNARCKIANAKPIASFAVQRVTDLMEIVIPHFNLHPLLAKKRNDFAVWRRGVELMAAIQDRPLLPRYVVGGSLPKWTDEDREQFRLLSLELAEQRKYVT